MSASDYTIRSQGVMCPMGYLGSPVGRGSVTLNVTGLKLVSTVDEDIVAGMGVLVNGEVMRVEAVALPNITVARGCADTIPQEHPINSKVWFFSRNASTDNREYTAASTIGVKLLPFTMSGGAVPVANAPPLALTFNWRFIRPYPPANFMCKGVPWYSSTMVMLPADTGLTFTWAHRDRIMQADQLLGHTESSVGPEAGTTYTARVRNLAGTVLREVTGITGTSWEYTRSMGLADLPDADGYIDIVSVRDTFESWQSYRTSVRVVTDASRITEASEIRDDESGAIRTEE